LSGFNALDGLLFGGFIGVGNGGPKNIFDHTSRETLYEEFDGFWVREMISRDSSEAFEVVGVLIDFRPFQTKGFQLSSGALLTLGVLILCGEFCEKLFPDRWDVVDRLESIDPFSHGPRPLSDEWSLDKC